MITEKEDLYMEQGRSAPKIPYMKYEYTLGRKYIQETKKADLSDIIQN